jgi:hypothetical protein
LVTFSKRITRSRIGGGRLFLDIYGLGVPSPFRAGLTLVVALAVTGVAVVAGVTLRSPSPSPQPAPRHRPAQPLATRLASVDTTTAVVRRGAFCDAVPAGDVRAAVDDAAPRLTAWSNGDLLPGSKDVAHEFGCSWAAASGAVAAGWVFAPPVPVQRAQELVASARSQRGCTPLAGAAAFGAPSLALKCVSGGRTTVSYRGLFGDAWLVCQFTGSGTADPADVADRWCASVLAAAGR